MSLAQMDIVPSGCQSWFARVVGGTRDRWAYCSTLAVYVFRRSDNTLEHLLTGHTRVVTGLSWSPHNNDLLVTGGNDKRLLVWSASSGVVRHSLSTDAVPLHMEWSPHTKDSIIFSSDDGVVRLWRVGEQSAPVVIHVADNPTTVARWNVRRTGILCAGHLDGSLSLFSIHDRSLTRVPAPEGVDCEVVELQWDQLSAYYLLVAYKSGALGLFDMESRTQLQSFEKQGTAVSAMAWLPWEPGNFITVNGRGGVLRVWNVSQRTPQRLIRVATQSVMSLSLLPDSREFAVALVDGSAGIFDVASERLLYRGLPGHVETIFDLRFHPEDPDTLATASYDSYVKVWHVPSMRCSMTLMGGAGVLYSLSWSSDGSRIAAGNNKGAFFVWDVATGRRVQCMKDLHKKAILQVDWNTLDSAAVAVASLDSRVSIVHPETGNVSAVLRHPAPVMGVSWSPLRRDRLITCCSDAIVRVFDLPRVSPVLELKGHKGRVFHAEWNPVVENLVATSSDDMTVKVWDLDHGTSLTLKRHKSKVRGIAWCHALPHILLSGGWDGLICTWDVRARECVHEQAAHDADVYGLDSHPLRPFLFASSSRDTTLRFWELGGKHLSALKVSLLQDPSPAPVEAATMRGDLVKNATGITEDAEVCSDAASDGPEMTPSVCAGPQGGPRITAVHPLPQATPLSNGAPVTHNGSRIGASASDSSSASSLARATTCIGGVAARMLHARLADLHGPSERLLAVDRAAHMSLFLSGEPGLRNLWELARVVAGGDPTPISLLGPEYRWGTSSLPTTSDATAAAARSRSSGFARQGRGAGGVDTALPGMATGPPPGNVGVGGGRDPILHHRTAPAQLRERAEQAWRMARDRRSGGIKREQQLEEAAALFSRVGALREYCEVMVDLGRWMEALAVSPAVGMEYWGKLIRRFSASGGGNSSGRQVLPFLVATKRLDDARDLLLERGEVMEALQLAGGERTGEFDRFTENGSTTGRLLGDGGEATTTTTTTTTNTVSSRRQGGEVSRRSSLDSLARVADTVAEQFSRKTQPVFAACCFLSADAALHAVRALTRGGLISLAFELATALDVRPRIAVERRFSLMLERCGDWTTALQVLKQSHSPNEVARMAARMEDADPAMVQNVYEAVGIRPRASFVTDAERHEQRGDKAAATEAYVAAAEWTRAVQIGCECMEEAVTKKSRKNSEETVWDLPLLYRVSRALGNVPCNALEEPARNKLQALMAFAGAQQALERQFIDIASAQFRLLRYFLRRELVDSFPVDSSLLAQQEASILLLFGRNDQARGLLERHGGVPATGSTPPQASASHRTESKRAASSMESPDTVSHRLHSLAGSISARSRGTAAAVGGVGSDSDGPRAPRAPLSQATPTRTEYLPTGSRLPHAKQTRIASSVTGKTIAGVPAWLSKEHACSLGEALMWAEVNPFSPMADGARMHPY